MTVIVAVVVRVAVVVVRSKRHTAQQCQDDRKPQHLLLADTRASAHKRRNGALDTQWPMEAQVAGKAPHAKKCDHWYTAKLPLRGVPRLPRVDAQAFAGEAHCVRTSFPLLAATGFWGPVLHLAGHGVREAGARQRVARGHNAVTSTRREFGALGPLRRPAQCAVGGACAHAATDGAHSQMESILQSWRSLPPLARRAVLLSCTISLLPAVRV